MNGNEHFSKKGKTQTAEHNQYLWTLSESFLNACSRLADDAFKNKKNNRFNVALYEAVFTAACEQAFSEKRVVAGTLDPEQIQNLEMDEEFVQASQKGTTQTKNLTARLNRARGIVGVLDVGDEP